MKRIVIASLVGGFVIFMWGAIAHTAFPLGTMGIRQIPDEGFVVVALRNSVTEKGLYFVPGRDMTKSMTPKEEKDWEEKLKTGPTGLLLVNPAGGEAMSLKQLGTEFATNVVAALVGAFLISRVVGSYFSRAFFSMLVGIPSWLSISRPYWNRVRVGLLKSGGMRHHQGVRHRRSRPE